MLKQVHGRRHLKSKVESAISRLNRKGGISGRRYGSMSQFILDAIWRPFGPNNGEANCDLFPKVKMWYNLQQVIISQFVQRDLSPCPAWGSHSDCRLEMSDSRGH